MTIAEGLDDPHTYRQYKRIDVAWRMMPAWYDAKEGGDKMQHIAIAMGGLNPKKVWRHAGIFISDSPLYDERTIGRGLCSFSEKNGYETHPFSPIP